MSSMQYHTRRETTGTLLQYYYYCCCCCWWWWWWCWRWTACCDVITQSRHFTTWRQPRSQWHMHADTQTHRDTQ